MDLLARAEAAVRRVRRASLSHLAYYSRGCSHFPVHVTQGSTVAVSDDEVTARSVDWLVEASELVLNGHRIMPRDGDEIITIRGGSIGRYSLARLGDERCYRWHGRDGHTLRLHTKHTYRAPCTTSDPSFLIVVRGEAYSQDVGLASGTIDGQTITVEFVDENGTAIWTLTNDNGITITGDSTFTVSLTAEQTTAQPAGLLHVTMSRSDGTTTVKFLDSLAEVR